MYLRQNPLSTKGSNYIMRLRVHPPGSSSFSESRSSRTSGFILALPSRCYTASHATCWQKTTRIKCGRQGHEDCDGLRGPSQTVLSTTSTKPAKPDRCIRNRHHRSRQKSCLTLISDHSRDATTFFCTLKDFGLNSHQHNNRNSYLI